MIYLNTLLQSYAAAIMKVSMAVRNLHPPLKVSLHPGLLDAFWLTAGLH